MPEIVSRLLRPACSLVVKFTSDGNIEVLARVFDATANPPAYVETPLSQPVAIVDSQSFVFGVDNSTAKDAAGLLVESFGGWDDAWDDEAARVVGGEAFPFGWDPIGQARGTNPRATKPATVRGTYFGPTSQQAKNMASQVVIQGVNKSLTANIPDNVALFYLALWLPAGVKGYVRFPGWQGAGKDTTFTDADAKKALRR